VCESACFTVDDCSEWPIWLNETRLQSHFSSRAVHKVAKPESKDTEMLTEVPR
jgi:hypothetical protein